MIGGMGQGRTALERRFTAFWLCALVFASAMVAAPKADAFIYWVNFSGDTIGRANNDGTGVNNSWVSLSGPSVPCGVAVNGTHIYWGDRAASGRVGRANIDGTGVNENLITGLSGTCGVDVDGSFLYWANRLGSGIGRAGLDGSSPNSSFLATSGGPCGVSVDSNFIYWTTTGDEELGRATIAGGTPNPNFVSLTGQPCGVGVNGTHLFFGTTAPDGVGRANLDGTGLSGFVGAGDTDGSNFSEPFGGHLYWGNGNGIGRVDLDGSNPNQSFISIAPGQNPFGMTVDGLRRTTATTVDCTPAAVELFEPSTCTATVDDADATPKATPTGAVDFNSGGGDLSPGTCTLAAVDSDTASCSVSFAPDTLGPVTADGAYQGDTTHDLSADTGDPVTAAKRSSAAQISCSPAATALTQPSTCTATVVDAGPAGSPPAPTGTVDFTTPSGPQSCTLAASGPETSGCSVQTVAGALGGAAIGASYNGDGTYLTSAAVGATVNVSAFALGATKVNKKKGTATVDAVAPGPGTLKLSGKSLKATTAQVGAAGTIRLPVKPKGKLARKLLDTGKGAAKASVRFTPQGGGTAETLSKKVRLKRR
jgi:hypothetical protein